MNSLVYAAYALIGLSFVPPLILLGAIFWSLFSAPSYRIGSPIPPPARPTPRQKYVRSEDIGITQNRN